MLYNVKVRYVLPLNNIIIIIYKIYIAPYITCK